MAYTIHYTPEDNIKYPAKIAQKHHNWLLLAASASVFLLLLNATIRNALIDFLLPGDPQVTKAAITQFVEDVRAGEGIGNAVTAFCQYVIDHG